jgi:hypothetical protein
VGEYCSCHHPVRQQLWLAVVWVFGLLRLWSLHCWALNHVQMHMCFGKGACCEREP